MNIFKKISPLFFMIALTFFITNYLFAENIYKEPEKRKFSISLPGDTWALEIDNLGFDVKQYDFSSEGKSVYVVAENKQTGMLMSIFSEKSPIKGNSKDARKFYWDGAKTHPVPDSEVKRYERTHTQRDGSIYFIK